MKKCIVEVKEKVYWSPERSLFFGDVDFVIDTEESLLLSKELLFKYDNYDKMNKKIFYFHFKNPEYHDLIREVETTKEKFLYELKENKKRNEKNFSLAYEKSYEIEIE